MEKGTGAPIADATVVLPDSQQYSNTDEAGNVSFEEIDIGERIKIFSQAHETYEGKLTSTSIRAKIFLMPLSMEGELIVVNGERITEKTSKATFTSEEVVLTPGTAGDPLNVLNSLPGIVTPIMEFNGPPSGGFYVRGSNRNQNSTWVNGTPIGYLYHFGGLYSTINPALLVDFNIFLAGFQVEYDDVLGGVIDVKLRSPKKDRLHQKYSIGTYQSSILIEGPLGQANGQHGFIVSARRSYIDLIFSPETVSSFLQNKEDKEKSEAERNEIVKLPVFHDIQLIWEYDSPMGLFETRYFEASDRFKAIFNENLILDPQTAGDLGYSAGFKSFSVNWRKNWNNHLTHRLPLVLSEDHTRLYFGRDHDGSPFFLNVKSEKIFTQPELKLISNKGHQLLFGAQFQFENTPIDAKMSREPNENDIGDIDFTTQKKYLTDRNFQSLTSAPYIKYIHKWNDFFTTSFGLRYTNTITSEESRFESFLPRINFEYEFYKNSWLTGAWGKYVQMPRASEMMRTTGNPNLTFTESEHRVAGIKFKRQGIWTYLLEFFHKPMRHLVLPDDSNSPPENYNNDGKGQAYGADLLIKRDLRNGSTGWLAYSYIKSTRTGSDNITRPFSGDQPHTLTLVWSQRLFGSWNNWTLGIRYQWHSGLPYDPVIGKKDVLELSNNTIRPLPVYPEVKNSARLPDFYQLDFRAERRFLFNTWKLNIYVDIQNVLNTQNITDYDYSEEIENPKPVSNSILFPTFGIEASF